MLDDLDAGEPVGDEVNELFAVRLGKLPLEQLFRVDRHFFPVHLIEVVPDAVGAELGGKIVKILLFKESLSLRQIER